MKTTITAQLDKTALLAGILYLLTFVSVPTIILYQPVHEHGYAGAGNHLILGGILEIIVGLSGIATAVVLFPVLKRTNETAALGLLASRVLEAATIFTGVAFLLAVLTLRHTGERAELQGIARTLVILYDRMFLLGQSFLPAINDLLLGWLLYKSKLVPRSLSLIGIIGAIPLLAGYFAIISGRIERNSQLAALSASAVAVFEFSLGIYLSIFGFRKQLLYTDNNGPVTKAQ